MLLDTLKMFIAVVSTVLFLSILGVSTVLIIVHCITKSIESTNDDED